MKLNFIKPDFLLSSISLLNKKEKFNLIILSFISFFSSILDFISIFSIYPFINIIIDKNIIQNNENYKYLWNLFGSPNINRFIIYLSISIIFIIFISSILVFFTQYILNIFVSNCQTRLGKDLLKEFIIIDYEWHLEKNSVKLMNLFSNHLIFWSRGIIKQIPLIIGYLPTLILPVITLINLSPKYTFVFIIIISFLIFNFLKFIRRRTLFLSNKSRVKLDELNILLLDTIQGVKDVKLSNNQNNFINRFNYLYKSFSLQRAKIENFQLVPINLVLMISQLSIVSLGTILFITNVSSSNIFGIMTIAALIGFKIVPLINKFGNSLNNISNSYAYSKIINQIYDEVKLFNRNKCLNSNHSFNFNWKELSLKNVTYKYPKSKKPALKNVNLEIKRGLHYGFVGFSGAGKSTAVDICNGLLKPQIGGVFIDGKTLQEFGIRKWQSKIGYVPQKPKINDTTIIENIAYGLNSSEINEEKIYSCLEIVGMDGFVKNLPKGLSTNLGEGGKLFSGGQQQLFAIARALYKDPEIIILDEATSSLDAIAQNLIKLALKRLHGRITILSISHQFSNIKYVDHIFLYEKGKLINQGSSEYLYSNSELFKKLSDSQLDN